MFLHQVYLEMSASSVALTHPRWEKQLAEARWHLGVRTLPDAGRWGGGRWRHGLWERINAERGGGSALDKNSMCLNSCPDSLMISPLTCVWLSEKQRAPRTVTQLERNGGSPPARWVFQACAALNFSTCEQVFTVLKMC